MKPLFKGSEYFLKKFKKSQDRCLSRSERTTELTSVEEEQKFLRKPGQAKSMQEFHANAVENLNKSCFLD